MFLSGNRTVVQPGSGSLSIQFDSSMHPHRYSMTIFAFRQLTDDFPSCQSCWSLVAREVRVLTFPSRKDLYSLGVELVPLYVYKFFLGRTCVHSTNFNLGIVNQ